MKKSKPIYVETFIKTDTDELWEYTQNPEKHEQWDLRFSHIDYLPRPDTTAPQRFLYQTNIGFGLAIKGEGESKGTVEKNGEKTSSLKFWTDNPVSLIHEGAGYWKYISHKNGTRFFTQYSYKTRFGLAGRLFDQMIFRPLMGWATAWSFDSLRLWLEKGIHPNQSFRRSLMQAIVILTLAFAWIYQGAVPKLIHHDRGELALLQGLHIFSGGFESTFLSLVGIGEILFGLCFLFFWRKRLIFYFNIIVLILLGISAFLGEASVFLAPFNPVTLNILMISLSIIGIVNREDLADARKCKRKR